jgi:hypothetical protein
MSREFKTIAAVALLMGMAALMGGCKKCECENNNGGGGTTPPSSISYSGTNVVNSNCVQFIDKWKSLENGCEHNMHVKLSCASDSDTSRLELDGNCIKEFYGTNEVQVTKTIENGSHRILCYTLGVANSVVDVTFDQDENGRVNNWTSLVNP